MSRSIQRKAKERSQNKETTELHAGQDAGRCKDTPGAGDVVLVPAGADGPGPRGGGSESTTVRSGFLNSVTRLWLWKIPLS